MSHPNLGNALDHVVVIMFENRSFDNMLGRLYEPGEVAFVRGRGRAGSSATRSRTGPRDAEPGRAAVPYGVAADMNTP